jgi:hypothetical protein
MLRQIGSAAAIFVAIAAASMLSAAQAVPAGKVSRLGQPFAPVCKAGEITDSRPDPAWVGASFAGDNCRAPAIPAAVNGATVSRERVVAGMAAMKSYVAASNAFQQCIHDFVAARRAQAGKSHKPLAMPLVILENHRIIASENNKKKVAGQVRAAIVAFNEYGSDCP